MSIGDGLDKEGGDSSHGFLGHIDPPLRDVANSIELSKLFLLGNHVMKNLSNYSFEGGCCCCYQFV